MKRIILLLSVAVPALAVYTYTTIDTLTSANSATWQANGSPTYNATGLNSSSAASLISKITTPGNANQYEVTAKLNLTANGGSYYLYLKASQDAYTNGSTSTGTFFAFEVANPVFLNGACTATLNLWKRFNGNVYQMGTTTMPCKNGMTIHGVADAYNDVYLYAEGASYLGIQDFDITTGQPGIGIRNTTSNTISLAQVGPRDTIAPGTVPTTQVSTNVNWRSVEMQWQGAADDVHGIGISGYNMFRNGTYLGFKRNSTFVDDTLSPSTTYNYQFVAVDLHNNSGGTTNVPVTTPPLYQGSQWTTGVRSTGNYWGSMGENIDLLSGNLNYTIPLLSAKSRSGGANFNLTYNAQQWRQDAAGIWKHGVDSGYGWGWKLQAGSITPMYSDYWTIHHYIFIDSTGTEYYLSSNTSGIWRSQSGFYGEYDAAAKRLYFPDGSFWEFDAESTGTEQDAGTKYPTKMQDSNGNFIAIRYKAGNGVTWSNSSARIDEIEDARAIQGCISSGTYTSYKFTYNNDAIPHLTNIANCFNIGPNITFTYLSNVNLVSPWSATSYGTTTSLHTFTGIPGETHTFNYTGSLELSKMTTPSGGYLRWDYASVPLITGSKREVQYRYWSTGGGAPEQTYQFGHPNDAGNNVHSYTTVLDASQTADKAYFWRADGLLMPSMNEPCPVT